MTQDEQYLNLLSTFHFVYAGIKALFSCVFLIHVAIGIAMLCGAMDGNDAPPRFLGLLFVFIGSAFIIFAWIMAALIVAAGANLKRRTRRTFCIVIAAIECISMPLGTVLGVFTLIVLLKDSVRVLFEAQKATGQHS
ncbi:MAG: hypothetical protein JW749_01890 [Sedimentisphaerales bacterium]|nr:hypothetical protein [Sedimentisphaerales bacterium]